MAEQKNPFGTCGAGSNAFKAAYDRLKAESAAARGNIEQDYSGAYQQLRKQNYGQGLGAAAQSGLSGGQAAQSANRVSAAQMGALGGLMQGQERAMREQKAGEASIYSNALLEGQQAQQMDTDRLNQIRAILTNPDGTQKEQEDLTDIEQQQLSALGYTPTQPTGPIGYLRKGIQGGGVFFDENTARNNPPIEGNWSLVKVGNKWKWLKNTGLNTNAVATSSNGVVAK
jgi:hypothetical protein